jgi:8-amino-7-oxononanoate synthase
MLEWLNEQLDKLDQQGLLRKLRRMDMSSEASTKVEGRDVHLFSTNNYLGLATDPRVKEKAITAIQQWGTGSGGSRLTTGNFALHEDLERTLASFKGKEKAIVFSSGFLANVGTISCLMDKGDVIFSDALNHASIIDGCRLSHADTFVYDHVNIKDLEQKLRHAGGYRHRLIVTDGIFSMDGNIAPLPEITDLANKYGAWVMVDDAHATGVLGKKGAGTAEYFGLTDKVDILMGTMSKAIGAEGGYVAASSSVIDFLQNRARSFIFQTSLSPGVVAAALESLRIIREEPERRERLQDNAYYLRASLSELGFSVIEGSTPIIAVIIGEANQAMEFSRRLEEAGFFAPAIRPPTVPIGGSRIRITLMATHTKQQINSLLQCFARIGREMGMIS